MRILFLLFFSYILTTFAALTAEWRSRSIYQVLTDRFARPDGRTNATCNTEDRLYCGGTWQGLINKLDYIQGMGFDAVSALSYCLSYCNPGEFQIWISPVTKNLPQKTAYGYAFHGYWQQDIYSVNENFGTSGDLMSLSGALHNRSMYLMVDVVVNHLGYDLGGASIQNVDYSVFNPFNRPSDFHSYCTIDYNNQTSIEDCWLGDQNVILPDLNTEDQGVINTWHSWIKDLVGNYSIDGLRIDTVKHVSKAFWAPFETAAGVFSTGEVFDGDVSNTCSYQKVLSSVLNYPMYYPLLNAFLSTSSSMSDFANGINRVKDGCPDTTSLCTFVENHDLARLPFLQPNRDINLVKNAIAFVLLSDGIPIIYQGQEQFYAGGNDPDNREAVWLSGYNTNSELYKFITVLNKLRSRAIAKSADYLSYKAYPIYQDTTTVTIRKGFDGNQIITVLTNKGQNGDGYTQVIGNTGYKSQETVLEILSCASQTTGNNGEITVSMGQGLPKVFYPAAQLSGSGICAQ